MIPSDNIILRKMYTKKYNIGYVFGGVTRLDLEQVQSK